MMIETIVRNLQCASAQKSTISFQSIDKLLSFNFESPVKVALAGLALKIHDPFCDTRNHQVSNGGKYCLRSIEQHTTTWCFKNGLFKTHCPGTLSNALRHKEPYDENYSRVWRSKKCKDAFLEIFQQMNTSNGSDNEQMLIYLLHKIKGKINKSNSFTQRVVLNNGSISLNQLLHNICSLRFPQSSLVPVYAVHAFFVTIGEPVKDLKSHNSPDIKGKSYGDVEIWKNDVPEKIIEIKHGISITEEICQGFYNKICSLNTVNFILTTNLSQSYHFVQKYNIICWNVQSFLHFELCSKKLESVFIQEFYKRISESHVLDFESKKILLEKFT